MPIQPKNTGGTVQKTTTSGGANQLNPASLTGGRRRRSRSSRSRSRRSRTYRRRRNSTSSKMRMRY